MAFVNEKGGLARMAESQKYAELCNKATGRNVSFINEQWTIDREREMLLVCTYIVRQDMYEGDFGLSKWLFYWRGKWISFYQQDSLGGMVSDTYWRKTRKITEIKMPEEVNASQVEMFQDLKEAFQVYRIVGYRDTDKYRFDLTLDYGEIIS